MIIFILEDTTDPEESFKSRRCQRICGILGHETPNQSKMLFRKNLSFPPLDRIWVWGYFFNWTKFKESKFDSETNSVFLPGCSFICTTPRDLLSGPGVKTLHPQCRRPGFHCWSGNYVPHATALLQLIVHMPRLKSLYTTTESFLMLQLKNSQAERKIKDPVCQR